MKRDSIHKAALADRHLRCHVNDALGGNLNDRKPWSKAEVDHSA